MLDACLEAEKNGSTVIVGGGDTATVVAKYGAEDGYFALLDRWWCLARAARG